MTLAPRRSTRSDKPVLVTGGAGFIGSHVVRQLLDQGHAVRVLHLPNERLDNLLGLDVERIAGDILNPSDVKRAVNGCDVVYHLAAIYALWMPNPERMHAVNVEGTRAVLGAAREAGVRRVVATSSIARFGGQPNHKPATEESLFALGVTGNDYAISKAAGHEVAVRAARAGQDVVIVAPCGPVGPQDIGPTPTGRLILTAAQLPIVALNAGTTNMVDVRDVARGHLLAAERGVSGESYLLGHRNLSAFDLVGMVHRALGVKRPVVEVPDVAARLAGHAALWITEHITQKPPLLTPSSARINELGLSADCQKAVRELGLPQTPLEQSVRDALMWFTENGYLRTSAKTRRALASA